MIKLLTIPVLTFSLLLFGACGQSDDQTAGDEKERSPQDSKSATEPVREAKLKEMPALSITLGSENYAEVYSVEIPFAMNIQVASPKVIEAARKGENAPEISLGTDDVAWWDSIRFDVLVDGKTIGLPSDIYPETKSNSLRISAKDYNSAIAIINPLPDWKNKRVEVFGKVTKDADEYTSRPLKIDFSAASLEPIEIDQAQFNIHIRKQENEAARAIAQKYINAEPDNFQGYSMMASLCEAEEDIKGAIKSYRSVITRLPDDVDHDVQFILLRIKALEAGQK